MPNNHSSFLSKEFCKAVKTKARLSKILDVTRKSKNTVYFFWKKVSKFYGDTNKKDGTANQTCKIWLVDKNLPLIESKNLAKIFRFFHETVVNSNLSQCESLPASLDNNLDQTMRITPIYKENLNIFGIKMVLPFFIYFFMKLYKVRIFLKKRERYMPKNVAKKNVDLWWFPKFSTKFSTGSIFRPAWEWLI